MQLSFPGDIVYPVSTSQDGSKSVLYVYSDRDPGGYYLFDVKSMEISPIGAVIDGIVPEQMGERRLISFRARDGILLRGILTIPPGVDPKSLPLVVHPHGGPLGAADSWRWDADSQLLASHGYAVLQINFRGSGGYGRSFFNAGSRAWNTGMINDITDGTRWVEAQGIADPKRVCIYGASYGGYAALMSSLREPDLYRCTIDFAGIYDMNLQTATTDTTQSEQGSELLPGIRRRHGGAAARSLPSDVHRQAQGRGDDRSWRGRSARSGQPGQRAACRSGPETLPL